MMNTPGGVARPRADGAQRDYIFVGRTKGKKVWHLRKASEKASRQVLNKRFGGECRKTTRWRSVRGILLPSIHSLKEGCQGA